jgi:hypothetical protein
MQAAWLADLQYLMSELQAEQMMIYQMEMQLLYSQWQSAMGQMQNAQPWQAAQFAAFR